MRLFANAKDVHAQRTRVIGANIWGSEGHPPCRVLRPDPDGGPAPFVARSRAGRCSRRSSASESRSLDRHIGGLRLASRRSREHLQNDTPRRPSARLSAIAMLRGTTWKDMQVQAGARKRRGLPFTRIASKRRRRCGVSAGRALSLREVRVRARPHKGQSRSTASRDAVLRRARLPVCILRPLRGCRRGCTENLGAVGAQATLPYRPSRDDAVSRRFERADRCRSNAPDS